MTIQEAIEHARNIAEQNRKAVAIKGRLDTSGCLGCAEEHDQLADWLEELVELKKKAEKYRWHDLGKDLKDLPDKEGDVIVCLRGIHENVTYIDGIDLAYYMCDGKFYDGKKDDLVIAWRHIEPFEEGEEE